MGTPIFSIDATGSDELQQLLARMQQPLEAPQELMASQGAIFDANVNEWFDTKRDPSGVYPRSRGATLLERLTKRGKGSQADDAAGQG